MIKRCIEVFFFTFFHVDWPAVFTFMDYDGVFFEATALPLMPNLQQIITAVLELLIVFCRRLVIGVIVFEYFIFVIVKILVYGRRWGFL